MDEVLPELAAYPMVMTPEDVAEVLNLEAEGVVRHMRNRKLPGFKVGGAWRARRVDIQEVMLGTWRSPEES